VSPTEAVFFWIAIAVYALASGLYVYALVFRNQRILPRIVWLTSAGFALHTAAIAARYAAQEHLPWSGDYENGLAGGWFIVLFTLGASFLRRPMQALAVATLPLTILLMGFGVMRNPTLGPMAASLQSSWLYVHVYFAWLAFGAYALAMGAGILYLLKERASRSEQAGGEGVAGAGSSTKELIPSLARLDELIFRYIIFGFITDAVMIASGAIWARDLWGSYWSWDPVETWSLITWLIYGIAIHLRITMGWRGRRQAWIAIFAILGMIITFFGVTFVVESSNHIFSVR
jgi:cytochrome c-type biogenesis protein CcsB